MGIQIEIGLSHFRICCRVWDGLDECEISRTEILSQSAPANKRFNELYRLKKYLR